MKTHARVVVIGGGVVGASVLYHLTKAGWRDVVLVERSELTSGSTWHAAGGMHTVNGDPNVAKLQAYTINLYKEIEAISGQSCGIHITAGLMLACTPERHDFLKMMVSRARYLGLDMEMVSVDEAARLFPLMDKRHFVGALYNTLEGHVDPSGVTHAYAKAARIQGAEVYRHARVVETKPRPDGSWDVVTDKGTIVAEHIVNAGGLWAREVGRMAGLELPVLAMEHQYLITEDVPEVAASEKEMLHIIDFDGEIYMRQEGRGGMLIGTYERAGVPWSERQTPWEFGHELLENDLERIAPSLEVGFEHFPALGRAGIRRVVNGPFTFTPDGNPLVGPVRGLKNYWVACGVMAGLSQGGGVGLSLSNWMIEGDPGADIWGMDVARYGDWTTMAYTNAKVRENYSRRFRVRFPGEELPAGRPLRTTPVFDALDREGAVFGAAYGLEHALWYARDGAAREEAWSFRRNNAFAAVARECRAVREGVGLMEISTYAKYDVTGPKAEEFLDHILANRLPKEGRITLSPMLGENGRLLGDFTVARLADERFFVIGSGIAEAYHMRWFERFLPDGAAIRAYGTDLVGLSIAGPRAREVLAEVVHEDVSHAAFPLLAIRRMEVGLVPALVGRISFTGDLGYEIWVKPEHQRALYRTLVDAGAAFGLKHFGSRALHSLRLAKGYGTWAREYRPIYTATEAGLDRFVALNKGAFIGSEAALREREGGGTYRLVSFEVDAADADASGDEPILHKGKTVGWVTSGGYAHTHGVSLAMGYVRNEVAPALDGFAIEIMGEDRRARRLEEPVFDPDGRRMRS
ncbi:MAG: FAD-dependent oxidoreductase [Microvirga sp.]